jgi:hypothetical protein
MAFYIPLNLVESTSDFVTYEYSQRVLVPDPAKPRRFIESGQNIGRLRLDRYTGTVTQLSGDDWDPKGIIFQRAAVKVMRNHLKGLYPEATAYEA